MRPRTSRTTYRPNEPIEVLVPDSTHCWVGAGYVFGIADRLDRAFSQGAGLVAGQSVSRKAITVFGEKGAPRVAEPGRYELTVVLRSGTKSWGARLPLTIVAGRAQPAPTEEFEQE